MASVSCGITSTRRSCPFTLSVIRRSTLPAPPDGWPCSVADRNKYAEDEATAPAAMTPLINPRRDTDCGVSSDIFLSSIAGSPRRVVDRPQGEGFSPGHDNPVRSRRQGIPIVFECHFFADFSGCGGHGDRVETPARARWAPRPDRLRIVPGIEGVAAQKLGAAADRSGDHRCGRADARAPGPLRLSAAARRGRISRADLLYAGDKGALLAGAARFGAHPGRGRARSESPRVHEAPAGAAAVYVSRRRPRAGAAPAGGV